MEQTLPTLLPVMSAVALMPTGTPRENGDGGRFAECLTGKEEEPGDENTGT